MKPNCRKPAPERSRSSPALPHPDETAAIVPAAGKGLRLPGVVAKQFRNLEGKPLFHHCLLRIARTGLVGRIVVAVPAGSSPPELPGGMEVAVEVVEGGARRQDSVRNGLAALGDDVSWVVVHDGARPLVTRELIERCLLGAAETGAAIAALRVVDTVKMGDAGGFIEATRPREGLWLAQTPQVARRELLARAMERAEAGGFEGTDEAALLEAVGVRVKLVEGSAENIKVTTPGDMERAARLMELARGAEAEASA